MGSQIAAAYIGVMLAPPLVALISGIAGIHVFPIFLAFLFAAMTVSLLCFIRLLKKQNNYDNTI